METGELIAVLIVAVVLLFGSIFLCFRCWKAIGEEMDDRMKPVTRTQAFNRVVRNSFRRSVRGVQRTAGTIRQSFRSRTGQRGPGAANHQPRRPQVATIDDLTRERSDLHPSFLKKQNEETKVDSPPTYQEAIRDEPASVPTRKQQSQVQLDPTTLDQTQTQEARVSSGQNTQSQYHPHPPSTSQTSQPTSSSGHPAGPAFNPSQPYAHIQPLGGTTSHPHYQKVSYQTQQYQQQQLAQRQYSQQLHQNVQYPTPSAPRSEPSDDYRGAQDRNDTKQLPYHQPEAQPGKHRHTPENTLSGDVTGGSPSSTSADYQPTVPGSRTNPANHGYHRDNSDGYGQLPGSSRVPDHRTDESKSYRDYPRDDPREQEQYSQGLGRSRQGYHNPAYSSEAPHRGHSEQYPGHTYPYAQHPQGQSGHSDIPRHSHMAYPQTPSTQGFHGYEQDIESYPRGVLASQPNRQNQHYRAGYDNQERPIPPPRRSSAYYNTQQEGVSFAPSERRRMQTDTYI